MALTLSELRNAQAWLGDHRTDKLAREMEHGYVPGQYAARALHPRLRNDWVNQQSANYGAALERVAGARPGTVATPPQSMGTPEAVLPNTWKFEQDPSELTLRDYALLGLDAVPALGGLPGLLADVDYMVRNDEMTPGNLALSGLGFALPFIPGITAYHGSPHDFRLAPPHGQGRRRSGLRGGNVSGAEAGDGELL